ncbi:MAG: hypothetical protein ACRDD8_03900 [Bacteroidales bacterium]
MVLNQQQTSELVDFVKCFSVDDILDIQHHTLNSLYTFMSFYLRHKGVFNDFLPKCVETFLLDLWGVYNGEQNGESVIIKESSIGIQSFFVILKNGDEIPLPSVSKLHKKLATTKLKKPKRKNIFISIMSDKTELINIPISMHNYTTLSESIFKVVSVWYYKVNTIKMSDNQIDIEPMSEIVYSVIDKHTPKNKNTVIHLYLKT